MSKGVRLIAILAVLLMALTGAVPALAQDGTVLPQSTDPYWQAWYWNNTTLSGTPVLQRTESNLDYDWGTGSPDSRVNADQFSARWTRYIDVTPGVYRFSATSDDGIRVWIDNNLIINQWVEQSARTFTADVNLTTGHHLAQVEYFENAGGAIARVSWQPASQAIGNWRGEYYNNTSLSGSPAVVRDDSQVNFNWGTGSPAPGVITPDYFSVRWTRTADFSAGNYRFSVTVDDGARLWVNDHLLIDSWQIQSARTYTGDMYLPGGTANLKLEYFENNGQAVAQLSWWQVGSVPPPSDPGEVVVDDGDPGFTKGGSATGWRSVAEGYGGDLTWTRNNDWARANYDWARWYPSLAAGRYEVYVYIPERYTTTASANYWISHANGFTRRTVNQSATGSQWVSLGTYWFRGNSSDYVSLSDVTGEAYLSRLIAFDAMKWVPR